MPSYFTVYLWSQLQSAPVRVRSNDDVVGSHHPIHVGALGALAMLGLVLSYLVARHDPPPGWEQRVTRWVNGAPGLVAAVLWPIMQFGSLVGPVLAAVGVVVWRRDVRLAAVTVVFGVVAWFAAKAIKNIVERGRPRAYMPDINVREGAGTGLGYISGHSTVAATTALVVAVALLPPSWRWVAVLGAVLVGVSRIVYGAHLPADVVGGWSLGTLLGLGGVMLYKWRNEGAAGRG
jgi:glycosyltransferase 2 family protein